MTHQGWRQTARTEEGSKPRIRESTTKRVMKKEGTEEALPAGMPDAVKAAVPSSLLDSLRGVASQEDGVFARPAEAKPLGVEEAARQWLADASPNGLFTQEAPALTLVSARDEALEKLAAEHAQYKIEKGAALAKVARMLANATDPDDIRALKDLMEQISEAKTLSAIHTISGNLPSAIAAAVNKDGRGDNVVDIGTMHRQLYDSDPEYRDKTNAISNAANKSISDLDKALSETDQLAKERGYVTGHEDILDKKRSAFEKLRNNNREAPAARKAQVEYLQELQKHYEMLEALARARGDIEAADKFKAAQDVSITNAMKEAQAFYIEQEQALYKAKEKELKEKNQPKEEIEKELSQLKLRQEKQRVELFSQGSADVILRGGLALQKKIEKNESEATKTAQSVLPKLGLASENASITEEKVATSVPNNTPKDTREPQV
jgi:hypothetical protein